MTPERSGGWHVPPNAGREVPGKVSRRWVVASGAGGPVPRFSTNVPRKPVPPDRPPSRAPVVRGAWERRRAD